MLFRSFFLEQHESRQMIMKQKVEIEDMKRDLMISQITPHFLFNSLSTIKYLCRKAPKEAENAVDEFSKFLRSNMDSMETKTTISFQRELSHVENYIALEKRRFAERLQVDYELETHDFKIPALTLQLLVENAIKHGISKRMEGGRILIATKENEDSILLMVKDDGIGFTIHNLSDINEHLSEGQRRHLGLKNVKERIETMSKGRFMIESTPQIGTTVMVLIPKIKI